MGEGERGRVARARWLLLYVAQAIVGFPFLSHDSDLRFRGQVKSSGRQAEPQVYDPEWSKDYSEVSFLEVRSSWHKAWAAGWETA